MGLLSTVKIIVQGVREQKKFVHIRLYLLIFMKLLAPLRVPHSTLLAFPSHILLSALVKP